MSEKIKLKLGKVCDGKFMPALKALCHQRGLLSTDVYRLRRTWDLLAPEFAEYHRTLERMMREHGARLNTQDLIDAIARGGQKESVEKLQADLAAMRAAGKEQLVLEKSAPGYAEYDKQIKALNDTDVETDLRRKVTLPERIDLTAYEVGELFEIIEEPS